MSFDDTLSISNFKTKLPNGKTVFRNVNFSVAPGKIMFVTGDSGCGKTTLLRCVSGLIQADGLVTVKGQSPKDMGYNNWRATVMYVSQSRVEHECTPRELLEIAMSFQAQQGREHLFGNLDQIAESIALNSDKLDQKWKTLSGGEAQRSLIAICLTLKPRVLLLDEPTASLDPHSTEMVENLIMSSGSTVLWISHDPTQSTRVGGDKFVFGQENREGGDDTSIKLGENNLDEPLLNEGKQLSNREAKAISNKEAEDEAWKSRMQTTFFVIVVMTIFAWEQFDGPGMAVLVQETEAFDDNVQALDPWMLSTTMLGMFLLIGSASHMLSLDITEKMIVSACRCVVQLSVLGFILVPIFNVNSVPLTLAYVGFMVTVASIECIKRPKYTYPGMIVHVWLSIAVANIVTLLATVTLILGVGLDAMYIIPMAGMLMGGTMTAICLALNKLLTTMGERPQAVEIFLSFGATRFEALRKGMFLSDSVAVGIIPVLQAMSVVGLVAIPGMMTGQILGGSSPYEAAKYQMLIFFMIAANACIGIFGAVVFVGYTVMDHKHRLRRDRLIPKGGESISTVNDCVTGWGSICS